MGNALVNLAVCHRCPKVAKKCRGSCACLVDNRDIVEHAEAGDCPLGLYPPAGEPAPADSRGLGDTVAKLLAKAGMKPCGGCRDRQAALNKLFPYRR